MKDVMDESWLTLEYSKYNPPPPKKKTMFQILLLCLYFERKVMEALSKK